MPEIASLQLFKILSDETRLGIVLLLREMGELCVCDLCTALEQSQPKTSRHLGGVSGNPRKFRHSALWNFLGGWSAA